MSFYSQLFLYLLSVKLGQMNEDEVFPKVVADERTRYYLPEIWFVYNCHDILIYRDKDVLASLYRGNRGWPSYDVRRSIKMGPKKEAEKNTVTKISVPWQALFFNPMLRG